MKRILNILFISLAATAMGVSCSDFLVEDPKTSLSEMVVYNTPSDLEMNIIGCYAFMTSANLWRGDMFDALGYASGLHHWKGNRVGGDLYLGGLNLAYFSTMAENYNAYLALYKLVFNANKLIENLPGSPVDGAYKSEINGEAHLIRAICYFTCVRMWGDVPLSVETPKSAEASHSPRTSYLAVYKQILDDLTVAEREMRDADRQAQVTGTTGRPNKWAATAFKAKVYTQIGSLLSSPDDQPFRERPDFTHCGIASAADAWTKALELAESVITDGPYSLEPDYRTLFRWTPPHDYQLAERIFVIQSTENGSTNGNYTATRALPQRPAGTLCYSDNNNWGRIRPSRFIFQKFAAAYGGVPQTGRADGLLNVIVSCPDPRFDATFIHGTYQQYTSTTSTVPRTRTIYPSNGLVKNVTNAASQDEFAHAYLKKYLEPRYKAARGYADFYLLRLADMYLTAAEAAAELSSAPGDAMWTKALTHIETIHARARNSVTPAAEQPVWETGRFTTKKELIAGIIYERFFEMYGEGHEFFDLRRRGAQFMIDHFSVPMNAFLKEPEQNYLTNGEYNCYTSLAYMNRDEPHQYPVTVAEMLKSLLCAFPDEEIRANNAIDYSDQNPYFNR